MWWPMTLWNEAREDVVGSFTNQGIVIAKLMVSLGLLQDLKTMNSPPFLALSGETRIRSACFDCTPSKGELLCPFLTCSWHFDQCLISL